MKNYFMKIFFINNFKMILQLCRYIFAGAFSLVIDTIFFKFFIDYISIDYKVSLFLSSIIGILINFILCYLIVFETIFPMFKALIRHFLINTITIIIQQILMILVVTYISSKYMIFNRLGVAGCTFVFNFLIVKKLAFDNK